MKQEIRVPSLVLIVLGVVILIPLVAWKYILGFALLASGLFLMMVWIGTRE